MTRRIEQELEGCSTGGKELTREVAIDELTDAALPSAMRLSARCFDSAWPAESFRAAQGRARTATLTARDGDRLIGYAVFRTVIDEAELLSLAVAPEDRRRGVGGMLLDDLFERVRRGGVTSLYLEVRADNRSALALYASRGFVIEGRRPGYYRDTTDALLMRRTLRSRDP